MAKPKSPLLSLESHGTIGNALTYQSIGRLKIARKKPTLPYFLTLPVQYQRWLYQDYAYLWRQQSLATQRTYAAAGVRHHLTGFQYWMKYYLTNLPDIAGMWYLDYVSGGRTPDYSRNENHGTVFGAVAIPGVIDNGFYFDGVNDRVNVGNNPSLRLTEDLEIECFIRTTRAACSITERWRGATNDRCFSLSINAGKLRGYASSNGIASTQINGATIVNDDKVHCVSFRHENGVEIGLRVDGAEDAAPVAFVGGIHEGTTLDSMHIGGHNFLFFLDLIDHVTYYNRVLDLATHIRHSERRWPHQ